MTRSILITDDSRLARKMVRKALPPGDYAIREAEGGQECLDLYQEARADLLLLDLTMPGMDGIETLERLRAIDPQAKVVVVTADVQPKVRQRALELGALAVLSKPPVAADLQDLWDRLGL